MIFRSAFFMMIQANMLLAILSIIFCIAGCSTHTDRTANPAEVKFDENRLKELAETSIREHHDKSIIGWTPPRRSMETHGSWERGQESNSQSLFGKQMTGSQSKLYQEGMTFYEEGDYDRAIENWSELLRLKPDSSAMFYNLGLAYYKKGMLDKAEEMFQKSIELYPDNTDAHVNLGLVYSDKGMTDKAINEFGEVISNSQENADLRINLASAYFSAGMIDLAIQEFRRAVAAGPVSWDVRNVMGVIYYKKGMINEALQEFEEAAKLKPDNGDIQYNIGIIYSQMDKNGQGGKASGESLKAKSQKCRSAL